jgi:hypothetical protein
VLSDSPTSPINTLATVYFIYSMLSDSPTSPIITLATVYLIYFTCVYLTMLSQ